MSNKNQAVNTDTPEDEAEYNSSAPMPSPLATAPLATNNNSYQDNSVSSSAQLWTPEQAGAQRARAMGSGSGIMPAVGNLNSTNKPFQTDNWKQYLPDNLKSYAGNAIGNYISSGIGSLFGGSSSNQVPLVTDVTKGEDT